MYAQLDHVHHFVNLLGYGASVVLHMLLLIRYHLDVLKEARVLSRGAVVTQTLFQMQWIQTGFRRSQVL